MNTPYKSLSIFISGIRNKYFLILFIFSILNSRFVYAQTANSVKVDFTLQDRENIQKSIWLLEAQQKQIDDLKYYTNQRFDSQDKRFDNIWNLLLVLIASIFGSIAYMYWDRREANRPLKEKIENQEKEIS